MQENLTQLISQLISVGVNSRLKERDGKKKKRERERERKRGKKNEKPVIERLHPGLQKL